MSTARPTITVAEAMSRNGFYPGGPDVTVAQTHTAWVFLAGELAYKVKKPVRTDFLDFRSLPRRRAVCAEEVRINRTLAPGLRMRLRGIVAASDSYVLADPDVPGAVEYAIEMRRFDESLTMAARVEQGTLTDEQVRAVARRLAAFHAGAQALAPGDSFGDVKGAWDHNLGELLALADGATARRVLMLDRFASAYLAGHRSAFVARAQARWIRDGHGDLRAEHVVLEDPLMIVDRLEFDVRLREIDVADDLAFLVMDLERLGAGRAARLLVASYREAGGDPGTDDLLAFYCTYRALVRCKVALLRAAQLEGAAAAAADRQSGELLALAERCGWRARAPLALAVCGPPASGKSTLAAALARRSGWPLLSSDVLRKRGHGLAPTDAAPGEAYTSAARAAVYRDLGERARAAVMAGCGIVLDATFGDRQLRAAFLDGFGDPQRLRAVECYAAAAVRERRARERRPAGAHGSDAGRMVAARLGASFSSWEELSADALMTLDCTADAELLVDRLTDWLDVRDRAAT